MPKKNEWALESKLGISLFSIDLGNELLFLNVYGPYFDRVEFWDNMFPKGCFASKYLILGGDLNIFLVLSEFWGLLFKFDNYLIISLQRWRKWGF